MGNVLPTMVTAAAADSSSLDTSTTDENPVSGEPSDPEPAGSGAAEPGEAYFPYEIWDNIVKRTDRENALRLKDGLNWEVIQNAANKILFANLTKSYDQTSAFQLEDIAQQGPYNRKVETLTFRVWGSRVNLLGMASLLNLAEDVGSLVNLRKLTIEIGKHEEANDHTGPFFNWSHIVNANADLIGGLWVILSRLGPRCVDLEINCRAKSEHIMRVMIATVISFSNIAPTIDPLTGQSSYTDPATGLPMADGGDLNLWNRFGKITLSSCAEDLETPGVPFVYLAQAFYMASKLPIISIASTTNWNRLDRGYQWFLNRPYDLVGLQKITLAGVACSAEEFERLLARSVDVKIIHLSTIALMYNANNPTHDGWARVFAFLRTFPNLRLFTYRRLLMVPCNNALDISNFTSASKPEYHSPNAARTLLPASHEKEVPAPRADKEKTEHELGSLLDHTATVMLRDTGRKAFRTRREQGYVKRAQQANKIINSSRLTRERRNAWKKARANIAHQVGNRSVQAWIDGDLTLHQVG